MKPENQKIVDSMCDKNIPRYVRKADQYLPHPPDDDAAFAQSLADDCRELIKSASDAEHLEIRPYILQKIKKCRTELEM